MKIVNALGWKEDRFSVSVVESVPVHTLPEDCKLLVVSTRTNGDIRQLLELYFQCSPEEKLSEIELAGSLASTFECSILISDESADPYSRIAVDASGQITKVAIDPVALDEGERYLFSSFTQPSESR